MPSETGQRSARVEASRRLQCRVSFRRHSTRLSAIGTVVAAFPPSSLCLSQVSSSAASAARKSLSAKDLAGWIPVTSTGMRVEGGARRYHNRRSAAGCCRALRPSPRYRRGDLAGDGGVRLCPVLGQRDMEDAGYHDRHDENGDGGAKPRFDHPHVLQQGVNCRCGFQSVKWRYSCGSGPAVPRVTSDMVNHVCTGFGGRPATIMRRHHVLDMFLATTRRPMRSAHG